MPFLLDTKLNDREPVYLQIVRQVKVQMAIGRLRPGEPLPSRRELAALLGINPNTVQKAYRLLEEEGILSTEQSVRSEVQGTAATLSRIRTELTREAADDFIRRAQELGLDFQEAVRLLSDQWS